MKNLEIDYYTDGYNVEQISCVNITIACATGKFSYENYYYYSFLSTMYNNWACDQLSREEIIELMGIRKKPLSIKDSEDFIKQISNSIDNGNPVLLYSRYSRMFFATQYKMEALPFVTMLVIDGYDNEKGTVRIRTYIHQVDFNHHISGQKDFFVEAFSYLYLKEEHIIEMWEDSIKDGVEGVFELENYSEAVITNYDELIEYYLKKVNIQNEDYQNLKDYIDKKDKKLVRKHLYNSIVLFMDVLKRYIKQNLNVELHNIKIDEKIQQFLIDRNMLANRIMKHIVVGKSVIKDEDIETLRCSDLALYDLVYNVHSIINNEKQKEAINYALNASVTADSDILNAPVSNAVNGTMLNGEDCWCSTYTYSEHWLVVDLETERKVSKFIVKHHPEKKNIVTREYRIEGSADSEQWDTLIDVKDNNDFVNEFVIDPVTYQYFRLYIIKPGMDNAARIFSFEIY